jgi:hypothetical protein
MSFLSNAYDALYTLLKSRTLTRRGWVRAGVVGGKRAWTDPRDLEAGHPRPISTWRALERQRGLDAEIRHSTIPGQRSQPRRLSRLERLLDLPFLLEDAITTLWAGRILKPRGWTRAGRDARGMRLWRHPAGRPAYSGNPFWWTLDALMQQRADDYGPDVLRGD